MSGTDVPVLVASVPGKDVPGLVVTVSMAAVPVAAVLVSESVISLLLCLGCVKYNYWYNILLLVIFFHFVDFYFKSWWLVLSIASLQSWVSQNFLVAD